MLACRALLSFSVYLPPGTYVLRVSTIRDKSMIHDKELASLFFHSSQNACDVRHRSTGAAEARKYSSEYTNPCRPAQKHHHIVLPDWARKADPPPKVLLQTLSDLEKTRAAFAPVARSWLDLPSFSFCEENVFRRSFCHITTCVNMFCSTCLQ